METTPILIDSADWTQLTTATDFIVQNTSGSAIYMAVAATKPTLDTGFKIQPFMGLDSSIASGIVWGKSVSAAGSVTVTE